MTYAGAKGRMEFGQLAGLGRAYALQPKLDGIYAEVETDERGIVVSVRSRSGGPVGKPARDVLGAKIAAEAAVFAGELESHTEAGRAAVKRRGYAQVHLFDALWAGGRDLSSEPYSVRRDALYRAQSVVATPEFRNGTRRPGEKLWRLSDGTYSRGPRDWRVAPIVRQLPMVRAPRLWAAVMSDLLEGIVVVAQRAPLGARGAKRKIKRVDTLDCVVLEASAKRCTVRTFGRVFSVGCGGLSLSPGDVVEVRHNGEYRDQTPRFPRIVRKREEWQTSAKPSSSTTTAAASGRA